MQINQKQKDVIYESIMGGYEEFVNDKSSILERLTKLENDNTELNEKIEALESRSIWSFFKWKS